MYVAVKGGERAIDAAHDWLARDRRGPPNQPALDTPQTRAPAYRLAFTDTEFLLREELRPVRLQLELLKPEMIMDERGVASTVVMFGGARIPAPEDAGRARTPTLAGLSHYYAEAERFSVVREYCGHGIGKVYHDEPQVLHYGRPGTLEELKAGMIFTIEPMINIGRPDVKLLDDGWTAVTRDRSLSAQFEHSIGITEDGCEIFTLSTRGLDQPPYA